MVQMACCMSARQRQAGYTFTHPLESSGNMCKILVKLASPNLWVAVASLLGAAGITTMMVGAIASSDRLIHLGMWLMLPLVLGSIILIAVVIPILVWANRRHKSD